MKSSAKQRGCSDDSAHAENPVDGVALVRPCVFLSACAEVDVIRILDTLILALAASLTLSPELSVLEITTLLVIVASTLLGGAD